MYQTKAAGDWNNEVWAVQYDLSSMGTGERLRVEIRDGAGNIAGYGQYRSADGSYTETISVPSDNTYNRLYLVDYSTSNSSYSVDNVEMKTQSGVSNLSYLSRHSEAYGTDISELMACRGTSADVVLNRKGKTASLDTVEWDTDHFIFTRHPISVLSDPSAGGTYIGDGSWMNGETGTGVVDGNDLICGAAGDTTPANWAAISDGEITMALYGTVCSITSIDFTGNGTMDAVAATLQAALRAETGNTETVTYDSTATRFEISLDTDADIYRLSLLETATADVGTDISVPAYLDMSAASSGAVYTAGQTALRSLVGIGVAWGDWIKGMRFRLQSEGRWWLIAKYRESNHVVLDSDYEGNAVDGYQDYVIEPYDAQLYVSNIGNPFRYDTGDIVRLTTADSDNITSINRVGHSIGVFMRHHTWLFNSTDTTIPNLISNKIGAYNSASVIDYKTGVAMFTGEDFVQVMGGRITSLDPEGRVQEIIGRFSDDAPEPHGEYITTDESNLLVWYMGLDYSTVINTAVVYDPRRGNWWLYNAKDAKCSAIIRDSRDDTHLVTGSTYDEAHGIEAFTYIHGEQYKNDGAGGSVVQGLIATGGISATTETAGYLTCDTAGSATIGDWNAITDGYFSITIDGVDMDCGPCDFTTDSDMDDVATRLQAAIFAQGDEYATVVWDTDHFLITSGTITNVSDVLYLRPYYPSVSTTNISGESWMNGESGKGVETKSVSTITFTLEDMENGAPAILATDNDGEAGCFLYVCDTDLRYGQYLKVVSNTADTVTVTPVPSVTPVAGWYWYMGGIVPSITKWFDFGSPQHKNKIFGVSIAVDPNDNDSGNRLALHGMQNLETTIRTTRVIPIGGNADTVNAFHLKDQFATQQGLKLLRPNSEHGIKLRSMTITHAPAR